MTTTSNIIQATDTIVFQSGARVRVDMVHQRNGLCASVSGHYVDEKGKNLPGATRKGRFANWVYDESVQIIKSAVSSVR